MTRRFLTLVAALAGAMPLPRQDTLPPTQGGRVRSLGLPVVRRPYIGASVGLARIQESDLTAHLRAGSYRDLTLPTAGLLGVALEAYGGLKGDAGTWAGARCSAAISCGSAPAWITARPTRMPGSSSRCHPPCGEAASCSVPASCGLT